MYNPEAKQVHHMHFRGGNQVAEHIRVQAHELRPYLERYWPGPRGSFVTATFDKLSDGATAIVHGYRHQGKDMEQAREGKLVIADLGEYRVADGVCWSRDGKATVIGTRERRVTLKSLGIIAHLKDRKSVTRFTKYLKRLLAPHVHAAFGKTMMLKGNQLVVRLDSGDQLEFSLHGDTPLMNGASWLSLRGANLLLGNRKAQGLSDRAWREGDAVRATIAWEGGFWKGHLVVRDMDVDGSLYDCKEILSLRDNFFFGSMGVLHAGVVHTHIQSDINYNFDTVQGADKPFGKLTELAEEQNKRITALLKDERGLRRLWMRMNWFKAGRRVRPTGSDIEDYELEQNDDDGNSFEEWIFQTFLLRGLPITQTPAMLRRPWMQWQRTLFDADNGRIFVPGHIALAGYMIPDPWSIDRGGEIDRKHRRLVGDFIYNRQLANTGHVGVALQRDPNANPLQVYLTQSASVPSGHQFMDDNLMMVSMDIAEELCQYLGGGDFDDRVTAWHDPEYYSWFNHHLEPYPFVAVPEDNEIGFSLSGNKYAKAAGYSLQYNNAIVANEAQTQEREDTQLGVYVNYILHSILTGKSAETAIANLEQKQVTDAAERQKPEEERSLKLMFEPHETPELVAKAFADLHFRTTSDAARFPEAAISSALEQLIDKAKTKGGAASQAVNQQIREYWANLSYAAESFFKGGRMGNGRIPASRRGANAPVKIRTRFCEELERVKHEHDELEDWVNSSQWANCAPVPLALLTRATTVEHTTTEDEECGCAKCIVKDLKAQWKQGWEIFWSMDWSGKSKRDQDLARTEFYNNASTELGRQVRVHAEAFQLEIVCELAKQTYPAVANPWPKLYEDQGNPNFGRPRPYPDGLLWTPVIGHIYIKLLDAEGITARLAEVKLYSDDRVTAEEMLNGSFEVMVEKGVVVLKDDHKVVGTAMGVPDGEYDMDGAYISLPR